jgi:hypothetical protein
MSKEKTIVQHSDFIKTQEAICHIFCRSTCYFSQITMNDLFAFFIVMSGIDLFLILYRIFVCLTFIQFYVYVL